MWNAIKRFFGFGKPEAETVVHPKPIPNSEWAKIKDLPEVGDIPSMPSPTAVPPAPRPIKKKIHTRANTNRARYYRRGGEYYDIEDDSLIMDLALVAVLMDMFSAEEDLDYIEAVDAVIEGAESVAAVDEVAVEPETTVADIDAAVEAVARSISDPAPVVDVEPTYNSYSGGSEYQGSSSTYSGGSSYSGGSDSSSSYDSGSSDSGGSGD